MKTLPLMVAPFSQAIVTTFSFSIVTPSPPPRPVVAEDFDSAP
jgi:hypothetical protein